ncbi:MAG: DUF2769 domain-containing protein [Christensenellales bacterium]
MDKNYQKLCICRMCPSYVKCGEPIAYCLPEESSSKCITSKSGCICPGCPVYDEKGFTKDYYCIPGSEKI